jgi:hypothetical protein
LTVLFLFCVIYYPLQYMRSKKAVATDTEGLGVSGKAEGAPVVETPKTTKKKLV